MPSWAKHCGEVCQHPALSSPSPDLGQRSMAEETGMCHSRGILQKHTEPGEEQGQPAPSLMHLQYCFILVRMLRINAGLERTSWNHNSNECCIINAAAKLMWFLLDNTVVYPFSQSSEEALQVPSPIQSKEPDLLWKPAFFPEYQGSDSFGPNCKSRSLCIIPQSSVTANRLLWFPSESSPGLVLCSLPLYLYHCSITYSRVLQRGDEKKLGSLLLWMCEFIFKPLELFTLSAFFLLTGEYVCDLFSFPR